MASNDQHTMILKPKRDKSLINRHPWVFSGAVARIDGAPMAGETIALHSAAGKWLAQGAYSPHSQIRARVWSFDREQPIDSPFFRRRLQQALDLRRPILNSGVTNACRLVNAESDGLPGLIVDRYDNWAVCQFLAAGTEHWKATITDCLGDLMPDLSGIYERSDMEVRNKEGLSMVSGHLCGQQPPEQIEIKENGCRYRVDIKSGHKTGFYLDQRDNRKGVSAYAQDAEVLNCFAYSGGFAVAALCAGARHVVNIDASATALELARMNVGLNGFDDSRADFVTGDVFDLLRDYHADRRTFDLIVLDPPKFATSKKNLMRAARGYKDINRLAFHLLRPGGILFTFTCSGLMGRDLFQKIVADAALDAGRQGMIVKWMTQSSDHPTALNFPEGSYLNGLVCRVAKPS